MLTLIAYINWFIEAEAARRAMHILGRMNLETWDKLMRAQIPVDLSEYVELDIAIFCIVCLVFIEIMLIINWRKELKTETEESSSRMG